MSVPYTQVLGVVGLTATDVSMMEADSCEEIVIGDATERVDRGESAPIWAVLDEFNDLVETRVLSSSMQQQLAHQISNKQLFLLRKPGIEVSDSRDRAGLSGVIRLKELSISHTSENVVVDISMEVENTGEALWRLLVLEPLWLPSGEPIGGVSIGLKGVGAVAWEGRLGLPSALPPGAQLTVTSIFTIPTDRAIRTVTLALVSEGVAWFDTGNNPVQVEIRSGPDLR